MRATSRFWIIGLIVALLCSEGCVAFPKRDQLHLTFEGPVSAFAPKLLRHRDGRLATICFWIEAKAMLKNVGNVPIEIFPIYQEGFEYGQVAACVVETMPPARDKVGEMLRPNESYRFVFPSKFIYANPDEVITNKGLVPLKVRYNWYGVRSEWVDVQVKIAIDDLQK